jgi:hypothetical protein
MSILRASRCHPTSIFFFITMMVALCIVPAYAADNLITGKYIFSSATEIVLNLSIPNPAPANLIVEQYLSPGNAIANTSPQARKIDKTQGNVKWLFKNTKDGILSLSIKLISPLNGDISAIVRYRLPQGGEFTELRITP